MSFRITAPEFYPGNLGFSVYFRKRSGEMCDVVENGLAAQMHPGR